MDRPAHAESLCLGPIFCYGKQIVLPGTRGWRGEAHTPDQWRPADRRGETDEEDTGTHEEEEQEVSFLNR